MRAWPVPVSEAVPRGALLGSPWERAFSRLGVLGTHYGAVQAIFPIRDSGARLFF